jgi:hypothetical protein
LFSFILGLRKFVKDEKGGCLARNILPLGAAVSSSSLSGGVSWYCETRAHSFSIQRLMYSETRNRLRRQLTQSEGTLFYDSVFYFKIKIHPKIPPITSFKPLIAFPSGLRCFPFETGAEYAGTSKTPQIEPYFCINTIHDYECPSVIGGDVA